MTHRSDLVLHIDNTIGVSFRKSVENYMTQRDGVFKAHFNDQRPHLMLVSYDPVQVTSLEILAQMKEQRLDVERIG